jgi:hypothetical protein
LKIKHIRRVYLSAVLVSGQIDSEVSIQLPKNLSACKPQKFIICLNVELLTVPIAKRRHGVHKLVVVPKGFKARAAPQFSCPVWFRERWLFLEKKAT